MSRLLLAVSTPGVLLFALSAAEEPESASSVLVLFLVIALLIFVNGFFVASEFSIIGVRATQMEEQARQDGMLAGRVLRVLRSPERQDRYIATAQLGITVASLGLGMYGEPQIAHLIEPWLAELFSVELTAGVVTTTGYIVSVSLLTYLHIVLGEMVPKSIALSTPVRAAMAVAGPMSLFEAVLIWPVRFLNGIGNGLLRLLRIEPAQGQDRLHTAEEIKLIVEASTESGLLNLQEEAFIRNIFDFGDRHVGQVMTPRTRVQALPLDISIEELRAFVTASRHSRFPVYEEDIDHIVGILHLKDFINHALHGKAPFDLALTIRTAPAVPEGLLVGDLLDDFRRKRMHMAIVLDEFGGLAGIVTLEDLVEEVVGEVRDEFDLEKEPLEEIGPGLIEVAGNFLVEDLIEYGLMLGEPQFLPDVDTVGGLIITWLGRPPMVADSVTHGEVIFHVLEVDGLAISRARVEFPVSMREEGA
jgi:CBS domain containing-hemolysin-like protein